MPELPEVESFRRLLVKHCQGKKVVSVELKETGGGSRDGEVDEKVVDQTLTKEDLVEHKLVGAKRQGKHLILEFSGGVDLLFHFGLTGLFKVKGQQAGAVQYLSAKAHKGEGEDESWPPKCTKLLFEFEDDIQVAFVDPMRLGKCTKAENPGAEHPSLLELAPDAMHAMPSELDFCSLMDRAGNRAIKTILLDQTSVVCGLGNYLVDDICHHAGVHPNTKRSFLSKEKVLQLRESIVAITSKACECDEKGENFPKEWLFHGRFDSKSDKLAQQKISGVKEIKVGGRATFFNPKTQVEIKKVAPQVEDKKAAPQVEETASRAKRAKTA
ncbi:formamidopyrimidine-DNA glycosylase [Batrachochytrium salamandrivorans]|nr:formamidopyrimidine-DNA glycosylase [Batrachochytrium salamandrivorans]